MKIDRVKTEPRMGLVKTENRVAKATNTAISTPMLEALPENDFIGFDPEMDRKRFKVTDSGIVIIPKNTVVKPLH